MTGIRSGAFAILTTVVLVPGILAAQSTPTLVDRKSDWSIFVVDDPKECFVSSAPTRVENTRGGKSVDVRRGDIRFFASIRPGNGVKGEVSYTGGYPYRPGSTVGLAIDGSAKHELIVDGEWAWAGSPEEDERIRAALKRGNRAVVTGVSSRGTTTKDTFSLAGFTAAFAEAEKRCS